MLNENDFFEIRSVSGTNEQQLVARDNIPAGTIIITERAILVEPLAQTYRYGTYVWDMVDQLLGNEELLRNYQALRLSMTPQMIGSDEVRTENRLARKHKKNRQLIRKLYFSVGTNNIGIRSVKGNVCGYGLFPALSRADHSCEPNAMLKPASPQDGVVSLAAKKDISLGEPISWSYFDETEFLPLDYKTRNFNLANIFRFVCRCERCKVERPVHLPNSPAKLLAHFDELIKIEARVMSTLPSALEEAKTNNPMNLHWRTRDATPM